ncbi:hypothetical protein CJF32_00003911 [Rutstroemia sp. NJR-2017a WRK4]|nr:hypothetical protein CJF32_00003911 [Rutstroemia sp. NJR-2017a WRK4]
MPFTEIITPSIAQTQEAREAIFGPVWSALVPIVFKYSGIETRAKGHMLSRDNETVPDTAFLPVFGFEYKDPADFYNVISSDEFKAFGQILKPFATARPTPEVYDTDLSPKELFTSPVSEIFRIKISGDQAEETTARAEWENFTKTLNGKKVLSGVSINLEERLFLGIVGWESIEDRERSRKEVEELKQKNLDWKDSFVVTFSA